MFDLFDFTPVDYDPFAQAGQKKHVNAPMPPTRPSPQMDAPLTDDRNALNGNLTLPTPMEPLPSWIPQNVQDYMHFAPSRSEGQVNQVPINAGEPYSPTPQIDDLQRLFHNRLVANTPAGRSPGMIAKQLHDLMQLPGFSGFTGGDEI